MAGSPTHVLVIDDAEELRALFRDILEGEGCRVSVAATAIGIEEMARLAPDLVVLDLLLGHDENAAWLLLRAMRDDARLARVPVVVCSAATELLGRIGAGIVALGAEIVPKPFDLDDFLAAVGRGLAPPPKP